MLRKFVAGLLLFAVSQFALAALTSAQLTTLKADIVADSTLNSQPNNSDGAFAIAAAYNAAASPSFTVWKTNVPIVQVGQSFNGTEFAGLSSLNATRLQTLSMFFTTGVNPSKADVRQFFDDIFSGAGGATTRANLLILWKRLATRGEKLFADTSGGNGANATPATLVVEGNISVQDVLNARNLP